MLYNSIGLESEHRELLVAAGPWAKYLASQYSVSSSVKLNQLLWPVVRDKESIYIDRLA